VENSSDPSTLSKMVNFSYSAFLVALALVGFSSASPLESRSAAIKVPLTRVIAEGASARDLIESDRAVINSRIGGSENKKRQTSVAVANGVVSYLASVGVGSPATTYSLIVDTGSSNTWVGATKKYVKTSTSVDTKHKVSVSYGSGSFSGEEYTDNVTLAPGLVLTKQGVGVASTSTGFTGVDGILGVGPEDLTSGTVTGVSEVPTVVQTAYSEGLIPAEILGVYFAPTTSGSDVTNGELTFGGIDTSKTTSSVGYVTVTTTSPASEYWGINISKLVAGSTTIFSSNVPGIVDTGTTLVYFATNYFNKYLALIPSGVIDSSSGLVRFPKSSLSSVPNLALTIGSVTYNYNKYAQLVEQGLYATFGLSSTYYYSWVNDLGSNSGEGLDFIIGQKFLERFYSVFDTTNNRVGFATTANSAPTAVP